MIYTMKEVEEAPLCICGKPRKRAKHYVSETSSYYYKTCGDSVCRRGRRLPPTTVGKKLKPPKLWSKGNPDRMCSRPGCPNKAGSYHFYRQKLYCSKACYLLVKKDIIGESYRKWQIRDEHTRQYLHEIYTDVKAGATKMEIRRKYRLDMVTIDRVIDRALTNRQKEIKDQLDKKL